MRKRSLYREIIANRAGGWASPLRVVLRAGELLYARGVAVRNAHYDRRGPRNALPIPVISVGNITAGGTGKTPFVIDLVHRLERSGFSPAVVSRGYGAVAGEPNDEERLIKRSCSSVVCVSDPDRARAGDIAHHKFGADVIVLDDAFQHRQLARTLDIVLIDATCPFGYGHLLPRGLLREPVESLRRADVVVLTRCVQVTPARLQQTIERIRQLAGDATYLRCHHRVTAIEYLDGTPVEGTLSGKRAILFAGLGNPEVFRTTMHSMGVEVVAARWWPDHHDYRPRDVEGLRKPGRFPAHDLLITTEKDAVKLASLSGLSRADIVVVRVAIDFVDDGGTILQMILDKTLPQVQHVAERA